MATAGEPGCASDAARVPVSGGLEVCVDGVARNPLSPLAGHSVDWVVETLDVRQAASQYDHFGVQEIDDLREGERQLSDKETEGLPSQGIPFLLTLGDFVGVQRLLVEMGVGARESGSRQVRLNAVLVATEAASTGTGWASDFFGQQIMTPFSTESVWALKQLSALNQAAPHAGPEYGAKYTNPSRPSAIHCLGESKTVSIISDGNWASKRLAEIFLEVLSIEAG